MPATPEPATLRHHASLDSLRALAVLAVIAYHYNASWARGGFLGVDLFFVLSGFLITTLLILEWRRSGRIATGHFWARRARRLLPALMLALVLVTLITVYAIDPWKRAGVRGDGIASLFYVANWRFVAAKQGILRAVLGSLSPAPHVVAGDRGAVLSRVAARGVRRATCRARLTAPPRDRVRGRGHRVDRGDGNRVPGGRPFPCVLRHRRPGPHDPPGRVAGDPAPRVEAECGRAATAPDCIGCRVRRHGERLDPRDGNQRSLLPRWLGGVRGIGVRRDRRSDATGRVPRRGAVEPAAGVDRRDLVRLVPVPLAAGRLAGTDVLCICTVSR